MDASGIITQQPCWGSPNEPHHAASSLSVKHFSLITLLGGSSRRASVHRAIFWYGLYLDPGSDKRSAEWCWMLL